jgi:hypothetical protein
MFGLIPVSSNREENLANRGSFFIVTPLPDCPLHETKQQTLSSKENNERDDRQF